MSKGFPADGSKVTIVGGHPHRGKSGTVVRVETVAGKRAARIALDEVIFDVSGCYVFDPEELITTGGPDKVAGYEITGKRYPTPGGFIARGTLPGRPWLRFLRKLGTKDDYHVSSFKTLSAARER